MAEDYAFQAFMRAYYSIKNYKEKYNDGITIILGAGCSLSSTSQDITTESIITKCLKDNYDSNYIKPDSWEQLYQNFIDMLWSHKGEQEKVDMLSRYLGYLKPSKGYRYLQKLIEAGFVNNIITTNFDMMTDICCENMDIEKWVVDKRIRKPVTSSYITLLKAHGDLENKKIRFAPDELRRLPEKTERLIKKMTHKVVILIGWRGQDGGVLDSLDIQSDFSCYWVSPNKPNEYECMSNASILRWMESHNSRYNFIYGNSYGYFDEFMEKLSEKLLSSKIADDKEYSLPEVWRNNTIVDMISINHHIFQSFLCILGIIDEYFKKYQWKISMPFYAKNYREILKSCLFFFRPGQIPDFMLQIPNNETDATLLGLALELRAHLKGVTILNSTVLESIKDLYEDLEYRCVFCETFWKILQYLIDTKTETWIYDNVVDVCFKPDNHLTLYTRCIPVDEIKALLDCLELLTFFAPTCSVSRKQETFNMIKRQLENHINYRHLLNDCINIHITSLTKSEFDILKTYLLNNMKIVENGEDCLKGKWITIYSKTILPTNIGIEVPIPNTLYNIVCQYAKRMTSQYLEVRSTNIISYRAYVPLKISQILDEFRNSDYSGLFIIGASGSGKTSALKKFIETESASGNLCIPLAAFLCKLHLEQSNPFFEEIFPEIEEKRILKKLDNNCQVRNNYTYFIIDGLNEFSGTNIDAIEIYRFLIRFCRTLYKEHLHSLKIIISCRDASFFYYMNQTKMSPGLNEFMNFIEDDSLIPVSYFRVKKLSNEEINTLCNTYFENSKKNKLFKRFIENVHNYTNIISPFFIAIASTFTLDFYNSTYKNDLYEVFITKMLANVVSEQDLVMSYQVFDKYFRSFLQNQHPTNYFYLVQEFDQNDQKRVLNVLRKLAEGNLIQYHENLMADIFRFSHDKIEEFFLIEFLKSNLYSNEIIMAFSLAHENAIFKESCIRFLIYMLEKRKQEFVPVFRYIYKEHPGDLTDILGRAFQICDPIVLKGFLDEGTETLEIIRSAAFGILCCINSYDYSTCIDNIEFMITQANNYVYLKSIVPLLHYIIALYNICLTTNYSEAERHIQIAFEELTTVCLSEKEYLRYRFKVVSAIIQRNKGHIEQAVKLLMESNQYFQQYGQVEEFYYVTLELGSVLREQTNFDGAAALYRKVDVKKIAKYPVLHQRLILQIGIIYKNKMQKLLYSFNEETSEKLIIMDCRKKAIQNYEELINLKSCEELILIEAKTELAETLILSDRIVKCDLRIKELLDNIREHLKNVNAPHRILQFMRIEANYYESKNNIHRALEVLHDAKEISEKYQLPFRVFECNYQIAHMIEHQSEQCAIELINEGIKAINAAIYFCKTELNGSTYLNECICCRENLEHKINCAIYLL